MQRDVSAQTSTWHLLEPASDLRAVSVVVLSELPHQVTFLPQHHAIVNDEHSGHHSEQEPDIVQPKPNANVQCRESNIERVAGIAIRPMLDQRSSGFVGIDS